MIRPKYYEDFEDVKGMTFHNGAGLTDVEVRLLFRCYQGRIQGGVPPARSPFTDQNFLNFMQFLGKFVC